MQCRFGSVLSGFASFDLARQTLVCSVPPASGGLPGPVSLTLERNGTTLPLTNALGQGFTFAYVPDGSAPSPPSVDVELCNACSSFLASALCERDCFGVIRGSAVVDACLECRNSTSIDARFNSSLDCQGRCFGAAISNLSLGTCTCLDFSQCLPDVFQVETSLPLDLVQVFQTMVAASVGLLFFANAVLFIAGKLSLSRSLMRGQEPVWGGVRSSSASSAFAPIPSSPASSEGVIPRSVVPPVSMFNEPEGPTLDDDGFSEEKKSLEER